MPHVEKDLLTLPDHLRSPLVFGGVLVAYSLVSLFSIYEFDCPSDILHPSISIRLFFFTTELWSYLFQKFEKTESNNFSEPFLFITHQEFNIRNRYISSVIRKYIRHRRYEVIHSYSVMKDYTKVIGKQELNIPLKWLKVCIPCS